MEKEDAHPYPRNTKDIMPTLTWALKSVETDTILGFKLSTKINAKRVVTTKN